MAISDIAKDGEYLWVGTGNPAGSFTVSGYYEGGVGTHIELALTAWQTRVGESYPVSSNGGVAAYDAGAAGTGHRFVYSIASEVSDLSAFDITLQIDIDPSHNQQFKTFILTAHVGSVSNGGSASGYTWVWDANDDGQIDEAELAVVGSTGNGHFISDDEGNPNPEGIGKVTQNIENPSWFDGSPGDGFLGKGSYTVKLTATGGGLEELWEVSIRLDVAGGGLAAATAINPDTGTLWTGTGNSVLGFVTDEATDVAGKTLELGLAVRETRTGATYETSTDTNGVTTFKIDEASDKVRFAYSVASDGQTLDNFDIKLTLDTNAGLGVTEKTFILTSNGSAGTAGEASGYAWIWDRSGNGIIDADELAFLGTPGNGNFIADDDGNGTGHVTQNIQNLSWFDSTPGNGILAKGTYDIRLEAFHKGDDAAAVTNHIVLEVAGGADVDPGPGPGPGPEPEPGPFVPPEVDDPSPDDGFNEAKAAASVVSFFETDLPTPERQAALNEFANLHYEAYKAAGVLNPELGPFEALGRGFAETADFAIKYGADSEADFIATRYVEVFGRAATDAQQEHFQAQIDYFELIYENAGITSEQADLFAKGAVLGQMIGHATLEPVTVTAQSNSIVAYDLAA